MLAVQKIIYNVIEINDQIEEHSLLCYLNLKLVSYNFVVTLFGIIVYLYIYIYRERERDTTSEKPVNDQSYGVSDRYGIAIPYK
jgi:hypothetical protein